MSRREPDYRKLVIPPVHFLHRTEKIERNGRDWPRMFRVLVVHKERVVYVPVAADGLTPDPKEDFRITPWDDFLRDVLLTVL